MTNKEFHRLRAFQHAAKFLPNKQHKPSRRSVKANGSGTGQVLRNSRVTADCPVERIFVTRKEFQ